MFAKKDLDDATILSLHKINSAHVEGGCQFAAIEAAKVLLNKEHKPLSLSQETDFTRLKDPIEAEEFKETQIAHGVTAEQVYLELEDLNQGELVIINGESETIDHAYIIFKGSTNLWLIDADREVFKPINTVRDFIQPVSGWREDRDPAETDLDYLRLKLVAKPKTTLEKKESDLKSIKCNLDLYKFTKENVLLLKNDMTSSSSPAKQSTK